MKQFNIFFGICVGSLVVGVVCMTLGFPADVRAARFGPAYYPISLACVITLLLVLFLLENRHTVNIERLFKKEQMRHPVFLGTAFILLIFLLEPLGFPLCGFAFLFVTTCFLGTSCKYSLFLATAITGSIHVLFRLVLKVPIPMGTLWEGMI